MRFVSFLLRSKRERADGGALLPHGPRRTGSGSQRHQSEHESAHACHVANEHFPAAPPPPPVFCPSQRNDSGLMWEWVASPGLLPWIRGGS